MVADLPLQHYYYNVSLTANCPNSLNSGLLLQKAERYRNNKMKHIFLHQVEPADDEDAAAQPPKAIPNGRLPERELKSEQK